MSPAERARVWGQVRISRERQGLPEHVEDTTVLDRLAARLLADVRPEHSGGRDVSPGRRSTAPPPRATKGRGDGSP